MKKWFAYGAIFLSVYLFFIVALLPASIVAKSFPLPKNIKLGAISGTIWQTKITALQYEQLLLEDVRISLSPLSLFMFNPKLEVNFGNSVSKAPEGSLFIENLTGSLTITDANIFVSANDIASQMPTPIPLTAYGSVNINVDEFVVGQPVCQQLSGQINWQNAAITALDERVKLGRYQASLGCEQGAVAVNIDPKNDLGLSFTAYVRKNGQASGNGYLTPGDKFPQQLRPVLEFLGNPDKQGRYRLRM